MSSARERRPRVQGPKSSLNRAMADFCAHDPRLIGVGLAPSGDPGRTASPGAQPTG